MGVCHSDAEDEGVDEGGDGHWKNEDDENESGVVVLVVTETHSFFTHYLEAVRYVLR